jgi:hypothetical protein
MSQKQNNTDMEQSKYIARFHQQYLCKGDKIPSRNKTRIVVAIYFFSSFTIVLFIMECRCRCELYLSKSLWWFESRHLLHFINNSLFSSVNLFLLQWGSQFYLKIFAFFCWSLCLSVCVCIFYLSVRRTVLNYY